MRRFETFRAVLNKFEQFFSGQFGPFRAILSIFLGQVWVMSSNSWKHDMALYTLDSAQNVSIEAALRHLTLAEKGS